MHEHDQEIIMALAEGTLDASASAAAEEALLACADCTADLALQRLALASLEELPAAYLTATESAQLHRTLKSELVGAKVPPVRQQTRPAWAWLLPVAGVAAVFLAAVVLLPGALGGDDSDDSASDEAFAGTDSTSAATEIQEQAEAPTAAASPRSEEMMDSEEAADSLSQSDLAENDSATTESVTETTTAAAGETTAGDSAGIVGSLDQLGSIEELDRYELLDQVVGDRDRLAATTLDAANADPFFASCLMENVSLETAPALGIPVNAEPLVLGAVATPGGEELVLVAYVPDDVNNTVFATQLADSCGVVDVLPYP